LGIFNLKGLNWEKIRAFGKEGRLEKIMMPIQAGDVPATYADVSDLVEDLGYKPATPIQEGIDKFIDWYLEFFGR